MVRVRMESMIFARRAIAFVDTGLIARWEMAWAFFWRMRCAVLCCAVLLEEGKSREMDESLYILYIAVGENRELRSTFSRTLQFYFLF